MLIQRAGSGTRHPPGFTSPPWSLLAEQWDAVHDADMPKPVLGPARVTLGWHDPEDEDLGEKSASDIVGHAFGWDNESPERLVDVGAFRAEWRPVSNEEYLRFWEGAGRRAEMPKSWVEEDGEIKVCSGVFLC
jgi:formylglycine-generating enzyme required for sulfatase activity